MSKGFIIVNRETPPWTPMEPPTRDIKVSKVWLNSSGDKVKAPVSKIEVELYKDGKATGKKLVLNQANHWTGEFKGLKVYESIENTMPFKYELKEVGEKRATITLNGKKFKVEYSGNMKDGFVIKNQRIPETPPTPPEKPKKPKAPTKKSKLPKTGYEFGLSHVGIIVLFTGAILLFGLKKKSSDA